MRARLPPFILVIIGLVLTAGFAGQWVGLIGRPSAPWWAYLFLVLLSVALLALAAAVTINPRPLVLRRVLAGSAMGWFVLFASLGILQARTTGLDAQTISLLAVAVGSGAALLGLAMTTGDVTDDRTGAFGRLGVVAVFGIAILMAAGAAVIVVSLARAIWRAITSAHAVDRLPWGMVLLIIVLPIVTFTIASIGARRASGGTFFAQATANRRNSLLLIVTMIGVVAATAEIIAVTLTFKPVPALWTAAVAAGIGLAAAAAANRFGADVILQTAGARLADEKQDAVLLDVVGELSIAANIPRPRVYVVEDGSQNAFATGRDPEHASIVVTKGLLERMDREELQGVIGHELGHVRNLDTRYALYVAVLVGLVALATDGFLRLVVTGWREGAFFWSSDDDNGLGALAMGVLVGIFLLIVAGLLRVFAPLFSAFVQASTSREREFLADATSVEFTRNPAALERALTSISADDDPLEAANRGTQHLWFRNPIKPGSDRRAGWLSTHPSLGARIDRLRHLQGLEALDPSMTATIEEET